MSSENDRRLADDSHPRLIQCQRCSEEFDWSAETCPECGWDRSEWVDSGRYGLGSSD